MNWILVKQEEGVGMDEGTMSIGKRIQHLRLIQGLTQAQLGARLEFGGDAVVTIGS